MPALVSNAKAEECASIAGKVATYCKFTATRSKHSNPLEGLAEYARDLTGRNDLSTLRALSREVDVWLKEVHESTEALTIIAAMQNNGTAQKNLPVLPAARKLRSVVERGAVKTTSEATLVTAVLRNPELSKLLAAHTTNLSEALRRWQPPPLGACAEA
jgi:hypothetical protein